jgi:hypothetical protein
MAIKRIHAAVSKTFDGETVVVRDDAGAEWVLAPEPEDMPRAVTWARGDEINLRKTGVDVPYPWRGTRGRRDVVHFKVVTD